MLVLALGCLVGSTAVAAPYPALFAAVAMMALLWLAPSTRRRFLSLGLGVAFAIGALRARAHVERFEALRRAVAPVVSGLERCELAGAVVSSPVLVRGSTRFDVDVGAGTCPFHGRVTLYGEQAVLRGDQVRAFVQVGAPDRFADPELGDPRVRETRRGVVRTGSIVELERTKVSVSLLGWIDRARAHARTRIQATFPESTEALARALVLGEGDLDPRDDEAFRMSGLAHLLAVSGAHLVLVVVGAVAAMRAGLLRCLFLSERMDVGRVAAAAGVPLCWAYADFAGGSGSALRAAWMLTAALSARTLARRPTAARTLGLSLLAAALVDPLAAFDVSFALSAAATAGLVFLSRPIANLLMARAPAWAHAVLRQIATTLGATIPCAPVLATFAPVLPLGSVVANLLAVPFGETAALPLCLLHGVLSVVPAAERGCALAASGALSVVRGIARVFAHADFLAVPIPQPTGWQLALLAVAFVAGFLGRRSLVVGLLAGLVLLELPQRVPPRGVLRVTFLDVGQGDAALVDLPNGEAMLVDGGGLVGSPVDVGKRVLAPLLRARRRQALAVVVLTHPHPDHFGGLEAGLEGVRVGEWWDTGQGERERVGGGYAAVLRAMRDRGVTIRRPGALCGQRWLGGVQIDVLAPCPDETPDRPPNDNSFVLRLAYGRRAFLLEGDAEREEEEDLASHRGSELRADVLKVGHHGSRTSSTRTLLGMVAPSVAVISCGIRNRYGHPHAATLEALRGAGARVLRTDLVGAVTVTTDGTSLEVHPTEESQ